MRKSRYRDGVTTAKTTAGVYFKDGTKKSLQVRYSRDKIHWIRINGKCVYPKDFEKHGVESVRLNFIPFP